LVEPGNDSENHMPSTPTSLTVEVDGIEFRHYFLPVGFDG
jgi:hypothetical protein